MIRKVIIVVPPGGPLPGAAEATRTDAEFTEGVKEGTQVGWVRESSLLVPKGDDAGLFWGHHAEATEVRSSWLLLVSHSRKTGYGGWNQDSRRSCGDAACWVATPTPEEDPQGGVKVFVLLRE